MGITIPKTDAKGFRGIVGRESKKISGKQGMHHHPQMPELGNALAKGMKPGGFVPYKKKGGGYY